MFYKELPLDEDNIFLANVAEHKEIEQIRFKKSEKNTQITGLSINQDTTSHVHLSNIEGQKALSDILRTYSEAKSKLNLDLRIYIERNFDITVLFKKKPDVLVNGFQYYDTTTKNKKQFSITPTFITLKILASHGAIPPRF